MKTQNPKKESLGLRDKNFKKCFNIGSNWGPRLLMGRGEQVDLVPLLGKWNQWILSTELAQEGDTEGKRDFMFTSEKIFKTPNIVNSVVAPFLTFSFLLLSAMWKCGNVNWKCGNVN